MPYSNPPPEDDAFDPRRDQSSDENGDIPASVAFMEMMRQAAARNQRQQPPAPPAPHDSAAAGLPAARQPQFSPVAPPPARRSSPIEAMPVDIPVPESEDILSPAPRAEPTVPEVQRVRRPRRRRQQKSSFLGGALSLIIIVPLAAGLVATIFTWFTPPTQINREVREDLGALVATDTFATFQPTHQPTPNWLKRIGIVSGHRGPQGDPGAICTDPSGNLLPPTENEINFSVAERVVNNLRNMGYSVDLLDEFDPRLNNYHAAALVSIHANTCQEWPGGEIVSGFLIAGPAARVSMRGNDDLLVGCVAQFYGAMTNLQRREGVTRDMTDYHNFREIHPQTPAAILELGFMLADRELLNNQPDLMAQAVTNGILCFVDPALAPTPPAPGA
jgi:N-acetylmuramoyl-L-alanine amidase